MDWSFLLPGGSMTIIKVIKRESGYVQISNDVLSDKRLTWKAKGILVYLLSKPTNWKVQVTDLVKQSTDGEHAVRNGLKELRELGYANLRKVTDPKGQVSEWEYTIMEVPGNPDRGFPDVDYPDVDNRDVNNKDYSNKESTRVLPDGENRDLDNRTRRTDAKVKGDIFDGMLAYADKGDPFSWCPEYIRPLAQTFSDSTGMIPLKAEHGRWIKAFTEQYDMGIRPDQVSRAIKKMQKDGLTIGGPESITKTARSIKAVKQEVFAEEYR